MIPVDALTLLHERVSVPRLVGPAPTAEQQQAMFLAALRAPDHAYLRPWRFLVIEGSGLDALGELFGRAALMIVASSRHQEHAKVPVIEQDLACGVAVGNMLLAAHAMGLGAVWRTGALAYHPVVRRGLALEENEHILAFLYVGHPAGERKAVPDLDVDRFFTRWPAQD